MVEDRGIVRRTLAELIDAQDDMRCGLAVASCEDFLAALEAGAAPDVVLMDIGLPGRSGIEGVRRASASSPVTRVVILTIHEEDEKVFDAICAGAAGYLLKPSPPQKVVEAIREVARGAAPINPYIAQKVLTMFSRLTPPPAVADYRLSARETEILQLLVKGLTMTQVAERLELSYHTIDNHVRNIYGKLHVRTRSRAVAKAVREGLV